MRRVLQEGQTPRPLQEKAMRKSCPHSSQWLERKYLDMDEFNEWVAAQNEAKQGSNIVALAG